MSVKLLTVHFCFFYALKEPAQSHVCLSINWSKCHIVGNHMSQLNYVLAEK